MEEVFTFLNNKGKRIFGIVHVPARSNKQRPRIGIDLLNPGVKSRVAPNRLNVKLARTLCDRGYYVLRFDPSGIGDSEGELVSDKPIHHIWGMIQNGLFVEDVKPANQLFAEKYQLEKLYVAGNCGGAITALLASAGAAGVDGLVLIDMPITIDGPDKNLSAADNIPVNDAFVHRMLLTYLYKLTSLESWRRLLTLRSDLKEIMAVMRFIFNKKTSEAKTSDYEIKNINHEAVLSLNTYLSKGKNILFVFAENDTRNAIFFEKFFPKYFNKIPHYSNQVDIKTIEEANHVYTLYPWQDKLFDTICHWISKSELD
jgi:uncharacterized protein